MSVYYAGPRQQHCRVFYDKGLTEEQLQEFYSGGDRYILGATPFDPDELLKGLRDGKPVADLVAWAPPTG